VDYMVTTGFLRHLGRGCTERAISLKNWSRRTWCLCFQTRFPGKQKLAIAVLRLVGWMRIWNPLSRDVVLVAVDEIFSASQCRPRAFLDAPVEMWL
jgi:hypothetical protein